MSQKTPNLEVLIEEHEKEIANLRQKNAVLEFYKSLVNAVENSGGCTDWLTQEITLKELSDILAINDVRFVYKPDNVYRGH